jgi:hypothetical protein
MSSSPAKPVIAEQTFFALRDFKSETQNTLSVRKGEILMCRHEDAGEWKYVHRSTNQAAAGWVPVSVVCQKPNKRSNSSKSNSAAPKPTLEEYSLFLDGDGNPILAAKNDSRWTPIGVHNKTEMTRFFYFCVAGLNDRDTLARLTNMAFYHPSHVDNLLQTYLLSHWRRQIRF